jgi:DHA1 family tetracycline resistance protein-like MFS transporter
MMTRRVSPAEQGELQGAIASVRSMAMLVGPGLFSLIFARFISPDRPTKIPGAPWYLASLLLIAAAAVALAVAPAGERGRTSPELEAAEVDPSNLRADLP